MGETFCLIKPEAFDRRSEIEKDITSNDFSVDKKIEFEWQWEQITKTYPKEILHYHSERANKIMSFFIAHEITRRFPYPMVEAIMLSSGGDTLKDFVELCGPTAALEYTKKEFKDTLRHKYGLGPEHGFVKTIDVRECRFDFNGVHKPSTKEELEMNKNIYF